MNIRELSSYGGPKKNYSPVVDPTVDEDAADRNRVFNDCAEMTHTSCIAFLSFVGVNGATPDDPVAGFINDAHFGNAAPVTATPAYTAEGVWTFTFPTEVQSELYGLPEDQGGESVPTPLNFRRAYAQCQCSDGTLRHAVAEVIAANVVRVRGFLANGTADDLTGQVVTVWIY